MVAPDSWSSMKPSLSFPRHAVVPIVLVHHVYRTSFQRSAQDGQTHTIHLPSLLTDAPQVKHVQGECQLPFQPFSSRWSKEWKVRQRGAALSTSWATGLEYGEVNKQKHKQ